MARITSSRTGLKVKTQKSPSASEIEKQLRQVLFELLSESESDSVRVAAAKALADRLDKGKREANAGKEGKLKREAEEHKDAVEAAARLLTEIAEIKLSGIKDSREVD